MLVSIGLYIQRNRRTMQLRRSRDDRFERPRQTRGGPSIKNPDLVDIHGHDKPLVSTIQALFIFELYRSEDLRRPPRSLVLRANEGNKTSVAMDELVVGRPSRNQPFEISVVPGHQYQAMFIRSFDNRLIRRPLPEFFRNMENLVSCLVENAGYGSWHTLIDQKVHRLSMPRGLAGEPHTFVPDR